MPGFGRAAGVLRAHASHILTYQDAKIYCWVNSSTPKFRSRPIGRFEDGLTPSSGWLAVGRTTSVNTMKTTAAPVDPRTDPDWVRKHPSYRPLFILRYFDETALPQGIRS